MGKSKKKRIIAGIIFAALLISLGVTAYIIYGPKKEAASTTARTSSSSPIGGKVSGDIIYEDASGFSFRYPEGIEVSDETPDEEVYYTVLALKREGEEMRVSMQDSEFKTLDGWFEGDKQAPKGTTLIGAISLDGVSAKQYNYEGKFLTAAIDEGVLYMIESPKDEVYWDKVHDLFVSGFAFAKPEQDKAQNSGANVIYEAEEVIE